MGVTRAIYPGSFDPITRGHLDVIARAGAIFSDLIVAVACNEPKGPLFTADERAQLIRDSLPAGSRVRVETFDHLLVDFARKEETFVVIRGLRAISDFEFEFQMALMNRRLNDKIETVFMMPAEQYSYISSRLIKEVFALGGRVHGLVPDMVEDRLRDKVRGVRHSAETSTA